MYSLSSLIPSLSSPSSLSFSLLSLLSFPLSLSLNLIDLISTSLFFRWAEAAEEQRRIGGATSLELVICLFSLSLSHSLTLSLTL